ncbi:MAG: hypothetical protein IPH84_19795, partial [Bacteroidales bacterium]|nr:hypothetical protein [Bacteroidales bacterium]
TDVDDVMDLTINEAAFSNAGADATICEGSTFTLAGSVASGFVGLLWSSSGTGTFNDATILHPVYTPSIADIAAGSVNLILTSQAFTSCTDDVDQMTLNITRQVVVNAGADATICQTSTFTPSTASAQFQGSLLWTHNGAGTLTGASSLTPTYTPGVGETGTIQLTLTGYANIPCADVNDVLNLTINQSAQASAGPNNIICEGSTFTPAGTSVSGNTGILWTTSGSGSFNNTGILNPVYTPGLSDITAGTVVLTIKAVANTGCTDATSSMTLSITRQVLVNAGADATICQTSTFSPTTATAQFQQSLLWTHTGSGTLSASNYIKSCLYARSWRNRYNNTHLARNCQ